MPERPADSDHPRRARLTPSSIAIVVSAVALSIALGAIADCYARHGYSATWRWTDGSGARHVITRTTEHRVEFPNVHRPLARYVQGWPFGRLAVPEARPPIDVELRARLEVPPGAPRFLAARARREATVLVDGMPVAHRAIAPGSHRLVVHWRGVAGSNERGARRSTSAHFALLWGVSPASMKLVEQSALTPAVGAWPAERVALWWFVALGTIGVGAALWRALATRRSIVRSARLRTIGAVLLVMLGVGYRLWDYDVVPEYRDNADELFATWNGWSLLHDGTTRGWSLWPEAYRNAVRVETIEFFGESRAVITPYFEHPPLMHLLVGAAAHASGAHHWVEARLRFTRLVPIALSAIAIALILAIGRRALGPGPAPWLAALLFAVLPTIAIQTRVIKEESLLMVLGLAMVLFFLRFRDDGRRMRDLVAAAVCAGLATLTKVPGIVWVPALVMLVAAERGETRKALIAGAIGLGISSLLLAYGAAIDWDVFVLAQQKQSTRPMHWNLFPRFFDAPLINHNLVGRGWTLFLWFGFAASAARRGLRSAAPWTIPTAAYLIAIAVGTGNWTFGWYIVPLYPFLCLGAGEWLARLWQRPSFFAGTLFIGLAVMYALNFTLEPTWAKQPSSWPVLRGWITAFVALAVAPYALADVWRADGRAVGVARATSALGLVAIVVLSGWFVYRYDAFCETYESFDRDEYFHR